MFFRFFLILLLVTYSVVLFMSWVLPFLRPRFRSKVEEPDNDEEPTHEVILELRDVWKTFDVPVLRGISFVVRKGETLGVLGKSGSGKSVTLKLIAGLLKPDRGEILFQGREVTSMNEQELLALRKCVSYVFQGGAVFDFLNVRENIAYPMRERGIRDEEAIRRRVDYLLEAVELENMGDLEKDELATGYKKQVSIARAIANRPEMILYDEPTTGVDPIIGKALSRLIRKLDQQENLTSIVVTHDLKCLEMVADRLILLKGGVIHFEGTKEEFHASQDPFVRAFIAGKRFDEEEDLLSA